MGVPKKILQDFSSQKNFILKVKHIKNSNQRLFKSEMVYWKKFHNQFIDYMLNDLNGFDNHVNSQIKLIKVFFSYLKEEKNIDVLQFSKKIYNTSPEEIPVIVLKPEQLNFLIYDKEFEQTLKPTLKTMKDVFVFGCTVALRYSDLMQLNFSNLEVFNGIYYLNVNSKKTGTYTRIKLPDYAVEILKKYKLKNRLLPFINMVLINKRVKQLTELAGWTEVMPKTRAKKGVPQKIYKDVSKKIEYRFCDLVTSHTMRRTAITTMLLLGMNETLVRKISGHAPNSKEFYKYVSYSQKFLDTETDSVFEKLKEKKLNVG
jgi:integrase